MQRRHMSSSGEERAQEKVREEETPRARGGDVKKALSKAIAEEEKSNMRIKSRKDKFHFDQ